MQDWVGCMRVSDYLEHIVRIFWSREIVISKGDCINCRFHPISVISDLLLAYSESKRPFFYLSISSLFFFLFLKSIMIFHNGYGLYYYYGG